MSRRQNVLINIRKLSWRERLLALEAVGWLLIARVLLLLVPFKRIAPHLGQLQGETTEDIQADERSTANLVGWAVQGAARHTPWESACLAQAIAAKRMLQRRAIPSTLYLGVAKEKDSDMRAHAWLRCGETILTGAAGREQFTVVSTFADME